MMMMQMTFEVTSKTTIFFKGWKTKNPGQMFAACIGFIILGILYEGLKVGRQLLATRRHSVIPTTQNGSASHHGKSSDVENREGRVVVSLGMRGHAHLIQTVLHTLQVAVGYLLMLAVMTYNVWICLSVVFGAGVGYLLFGWEVSPVAVDTGDHCN